MSATQTNSTINARQALAGQQAKRTPPRCTGGPAAAAPTSWHLSRAISACMVRITESRPSATSLRTGATTTLCAHMAKRSAARVVSAQPASRTVDTSVSA